MGKLQGLPVLEELHHPEGGHVEVEVGLVAGVARAEEDAEDLGVGHEAEGEGAEEAGVDGGEAGLLSPVADEAHLEGAGQGRVETEALAPLAPDLMEDELARVRAVRLPAARAATAAAAADFLNLPNNSVVELGSKIEI